MMMIGEKGKFKPHGLYDRATHVRNRSWSSTSMSYYQSTHRILDEDGLEHDPEHCQFRTVSPLRHHHHHHHQRQQEQDQEDLENTSSDSDSDSDSDEDQLSLSSSTTPGFPLARLTHHDFCCSRHRERSGSTASSSKLSSYDPFSFLPPPPTTSYPSRPSHFNTTSRKHSLPLRLPDRKRAGSQSSSTKLSFETHHSRLSSLPIRDKILSIHSTKDDRLSSSLGTQPSSNLKHFTTLSRPTSLSEVNINLSHPKPSNPTVLVIDDVQASKALLELDLDLNDGLENMPLTSLWLKNPLVFESIDQDKPNSKKTFRSKPFQKSLLNFKLDCRITLLRTRQKISKVLKKS